MNTSARFLSGLAIGAFLLGAIATPSIAQDKGKDTKAAPAAKAAAPAKGAAKVTTVLENDKVRAFEVNYKPGDENKAIPSTAYRVVRVLKGGTLTRSYADGKTEKVEFKTGDVRFNEPSKSTYTTKNTGNAEVHLYIVQLK